MLEDFGQPTRAITCRQRRDKIRGEGPGAGGKACSRVCPERKRSAASAQSPLMAGRGRVAR